MCKRDYVPKIIKTNINLNWSASQTRMGFVQKYPQAYENPKAVKTHIDQAHYEKRSAATCRDDGAYIDGKLDVWEKQMVRRGRR